jgi:hypothetical protein
LVFRSESDAEQLIRRSSDVRARWNLHFQGEVLVAVVLIDWLDHGARKGRVGFLAKESDEGLI